MKFDTCLLHNAFVEDYVLQHTEHFSSTVWVPALLYFHYSSQLVENTLYKTWVPKEAELVTLLPFKLVFEVVLLMLLPLVLLVCISPLCSCASCYAGTGAKISGLFHWEGLGVGVTALFFFYRKRGSPPHYTRHVGSLSVKVNCIISGFAFIYLQDFHDYKEKSVHPSRWLFIGINGSQLLPQIVLLFILPIQQAGIFFPKC